MSNHGTPCWYELTTPDVAASAAFYGPLLGWQVQDAGMEGFSYNLAQRDGQMIAGMFTPDEPMPHFWLCYFTVRDCDAAARLVADLGGQVHKAPADIPGTGRFAVLSDPQGAAFGVLQPLDDNGAAFDQMKEGHGNWHELSTTDPVAAPAFYTRLFGWTASSAMPMPDIGTYQVFAHGGRDIGGMVKLVTPATPPNWLPYFGAASIARAIEQIRAAGGEVLHGPQEVPGGAFIAMARDPQGAHFAVVGGA